MHRCFRDVWMNLIGAAKAAHLELLERGCVIQSYSKLPSWHSGRCNEQKYVGGEDLVAFSPPNDPGNLPQLFPNLIGPQFGMAVPTNT
jgi:hypothetical protein